MPAAVFTHDDAVDDYVTFGSGIRLAGGVHICEGAYVGAGALIRERVTVGKWALVGMEPPSSTTFRRARSGQARRPVISAP